MGLYKVYFDYEEDDAVEVLANDKFEAMKIVVDQMEAMYPHDFADREETFDSLNAVLI